MSQFVTYAILGFAILYVIILISRLISDRAFRPFLIQIALLAFVLVLLNLSTGFPKSQHAFGGTSPLLTVALMLLCVVFGMAAHYVYVTERQRFDWYSFLRPFVISPIVLLPLFGTIELGRELNTLQLISFGFLAFQNGFFWKAVLERAAPTT